MMLTTWLQDVRYAVRWLSRSPLFTSVAALSLAIGIGANTAIFSLANALLLRPLPGLAEPERLVDLGRTTNGSGFDTTGYPYYRDLRERTTTLQGIYGYRPEPTPMSLGGPHEAERIYGTIVTGNYFKVLGTAPVIGRLLTDEDDGQPGTRAVAVISHELWTRRFDADPTIPGQTILLNGRTFTIVGVTPRGFQGTILLKPDLWVPLSMLAQAVPQLPISLLTSRSALWLVLGGRLKAGATLAQAQQEMTSLATTLAREYPDANREHGLVVKRSAIVPGQTDMISSFLFVLMAIVGLVLLIACVNVAGMLLAAIGIYGVTAYAVSRRTREIGIRIALGADSPAVLRLVLRQGLVLALIGVTVGAGLAAVASRFIESLLFGVHGLDPLTFASAAALFAMVTLGATYLPARRATRVDPMVALRNE